MWTKVNNKLNRIKAYDSDDSEKEEFKRVKNINKGK